MTETLARNEEATRYELVIDGRVASILEYRDRGDVIALTHAETRGDMRGHGLAAKVTDFALADVRSQGRKVDPICFFVAEHMQHHLDQFGDLLVEEPHAAYCEIERRL